MSYWNFTTETRDKIKNLISELNLGNLYTKDAYNKDFNQIDISDGDVFIKIKQERLFKNEKPHKTNCTGDIFIEITSESKQFFTTYSELLHIISWHFPEKPFRIIVPSNLLSEEILKFFTVKIINNNLPTVSIATEQYIYYDDLDGGEILLNTYKEIINESKPIYNHGN